MSHIAAAYARVAETAAASTAVLSPDTKRRAVTALSQAIRESGIERKELYDRLAMSKSHFSKLESGEGDLLGLVDRLPAAIQESFRRHFADADDPVLDQVSVAEQMDRVAVLWLRLRGVMPQPAKASVR